MEVAIKLTKMVTEFDTLKIYVFSKYRYAEFRKLDLTNCNNKNTIAWLDEMHDCYVKPVSNSNGIAHYIKPDGQPEIMMVIPQDCCELEVLKF